MSDFITLVGAEDVRRAGAQMQEAANDMARAAGALGEVLAQHQRFMDGWLQRLEALLVELTTTAVTIPAAPPPPPPAPTKVPGPGMVR